MPALVVSDERLPVPIELRPMRSARRMRLRYDEGRGILRLTCPAGISRRRALAWAADQEDWVRAQITRSAARTVIEDGATIPLEGRDVIIRWSADGARSAQLQGDQITCAGPIESVGMRVERFLKARALRVLSQETAEYAAKAGASCSSVTIGDASSRWGSCSSAKRIRYSWRLILAPPEARRFVVAHEVAHLVHLNHGPEFRALERQLYEGDVAKARALLRKVGGRLRGIVGRL